MFKGYFGKKAKNLKEKTKEVVGTEQIKDTFNEIYIQSYKNLKESGNRQGENLSFQEAVEKYGITPTILERQYKNQAYSFYLMALVFFVIFGLLMYYIFSGYIISSITSLFVAGATLAIMLHNSVSCYRLKSKDFKTLQEWYESKEFFPSLNVSFEVPVGKRETKKDGLIKKH